VLQNQWRPQRDSNPCCRIERAESLILPIATKYCGPAIDAGSSFYRQLPNCIHLDRFSAFRVTLALPTPTVPPLYLLSQVRSFISYWCKRACHPPPIFSRSTPYLKFFSTLRNLSWRDGPHFSGAPGIFLLVGRLPLTAPKCRQKPPGDVGRHMTRLRSFGPPGGALATFSGDI